LAKNTGRLNKSGATLIENLVELAFVIIILTMFGLILNVFSKVGGGGPQLKANAFEVSSSAVCDTNLVAFLRAQPDGGLSFAEMIAVAAKNPTNTSTLRSATENFMAKNYRRGSNQNGLWKIAIKNPSIDAPFLAFGNLDQTNTKDTCFKFVPTLNPTSPLKIELAVEY